MQFWSPIFLPQMKKQVVFYEMYFNHT